MDGHKIIFFNSNSIDYYIYFYFENIKESIRLSCVILGEL